MRRWRFRLLDLVLGLRRFLRLPLHVARGIRSSALQRNDVIHDVAFAGTADFAGGRARMTPLKFPFGRGTPLDFAVRGAGTTDALGSGRVDFASARHTGGMVASGGRTGMSTASRQAGRRRKQEREHKRYESSHSCS